MSTQSADVERVCKAHKVVHTKVRNKLKNETVHQLLYCYVNLRLIKKIQDEKEQIAASTRIDPDGRWGDFFEAALLDQLEDERERAEEEEENASVASNNDGDDEVDDYD
jgi:hypothetical protein